jgi:hypothetical protein
MERSNRRTNHRSNSTSRRPKVFAAIAILGSSVSLHAQGPVSSQGNNNVPVGTNNGLIIQTNVTVSSEKARTIKNEAKTFGVDTSWQTTLVPGASATSFDPKCVPPADAITIRLGGGEQGGTQWCTAQKCSIISTPDTPLLEITRRGKALVIDAKVFGPDGKIVAEIANDTLYVNRNNAFRWSRPDSHSIEVFDQEDNKALSVRFVNPRVVVVEGLFYDRKGSRLEIKSDGVVNRGLHLVNPCFGDSPRGILLGSPALR